MGRPGVPVRVPGIDGRLWPIAPLVGLAARLPVAPRLLVVQPVGRRHRQRLRLYGRLLWREVRHHPFSNNLRFDAPSPHCHASNGVRDGPDDRDDRYHAEYHQG